MDRTMKYTIVDYDQLQSETIDWLRFPLVILVLFIHTVQPPEMFASDSAVFNIYYAVSKIFAAIAVPCFFVISGYYFFYTKTNPVSFTKQEYIKKLKKRIHSVLVPYIVWNFFGFALLVVSQYLFPYDLFSGKYKDIADYNLTDYIDVFTGLTTHYPIVNQLWYLRDLMLLVLISPVIYFLMTRYKHFFVAVLFLVYMLPLNVNITKSLFFFSAGGYFALNGINIIKEIRKLSVYPIIVYCAIFIFLLGYKDLLVSQYISKLGIIFGIISILYIASSYVEKFSVKANRKLVSISFFIYLWHGLFTHTFHSLILKLYPESGLYYLFTYFFSVFITVVISFAGYYILTNKYFPKKLKDLLIGGR
ncbi:MAG: acyltransferase [Bacteroidales bacterium]|nr:acyltransferase [Bacteroidales bacterium]